ncbi:Hypothetical predicted protein [Pelobates cultripes]|uniref:Uncharacterized protein n=1 Tax=Pelobates cultripes TaxID=61616 RepID=A0AAD1RU56_PELCU|nr:Hypothetical predicted protein [Pelobates cultripes]
MKLDKMVDAMVPVTRDPGLSRAADSTDLSHSILTRLKATFARFWATMEERMTHPVAVLAGNEGVRYCKGRPQGPFVQHAIALASVTSVPNTPTLRPIRRLTLLQKPQQR